MKEELRSIDRLILRVADPAVEVLGDDKGRDKASIRFDVLIGEMLKLYMGGEASKQVGKNKRPAEIWLEVHMKMNELILSAKDYAISTEGEMDFGFCGCEGNAVKIKVEK